MKLLDYFPPPRFLEFPYVGINITPRAVRFIEIVRAKGHFEVGRFAEKPLKSWNPAESLLVNKELAKILEELRKEYKLKYVEAALPEEKAYLFKTMLQNGSDEEIRTQIEFHLEENVPISLEESIFDYHIIPQKDDTSNISLTVSVLPKKVVEEYIAVFNTAGLSPVSFLIESQAIAKAIIKKDDLNTYMIVNIGDNKTVLSIVENGAVEFTSTLPVGSEDFTSAVVKQFNIGNEEARSMKNTKGFIRDKENSDLFFALISTASALKDEIERLFIYWQTHLAKNGGAKISKILLVGREASVPGLPEYLAEISRISVETANVWTNTFSFDQYIPPIPADVALGFGSSIGLALPTLK